MMMISSRSGTIKTTFFTASSSEGTEEDEEDENDADGNCSFYDDFFLCGCVDEC